MSSHSRPPAGPRRARSLSAARHLRLVGVSRQIDRERRLELSTEITRLLQAGENQLAFRRANRLFRALPFTMANYALAGQAMLQVYHLLPRRSRLRVYLQVNLHNLAVSLGVVRPDYAVEIFEWLGMHSGSSAYKEKCKKGVLGALKVERRKAIQSNGGAVEPPHKLADDEFTMAYERAKQKIDHGVTPGARGRIAYESGRFVEAARAFIESGQDSDEAAVRVLVRRHRESLAPAQLADIRARFQRKFGEDLPA